MGQVDVHPPGIEQVAGEIRAADGPTALRLVADFIACFRHAGSRDRPSMLSQAPATGSAQWDALLAGVAEMLANHAGLVPPRWAMAPSRFLRTWWFVSPYRSLHASALVDAPPELANRGVFLHRASLESV